MSFLKVLRLRHLAILWSSQVLSAMGDFFYLIAVMWIAVKVAGSAAGIVAAAETGSMLLFGLFGGVYADRWNRRTTMMTVDMLRALAVGILPILALTGALQLWHLVVVAVIVGGLGALFDPALQASLPALAGDPQILQATNGLMDITRRLARALGPSLAGVLIIFLPLAHFFTLDAISFVISALAVFSLGRHFAWKPERNREIGNGIRGVLQEIGGAMRLVRVHRSLPWIFVSLAIISVAWSTGFTVGVPLLAARVLGGNVGAYGLIVGAYGVGNVLSNLVIGSLTIHRRVMTIFIGKLVLGIGFFLLAFAPSLPVALLGSALAAIGGPMGDIMLLTMIQTDLPSNQIGKVYSLLMMLESAGVSLGLLLAVPLFTIVEVPIGIALCASIMAAVGIAGLARFGFAETSVKLTHKEQEEISFTGVRITDDVTT
ncbi:MAG TPA: MFS transporter [Ktedonobacteraceae bacterium]|nr:MFS transporter [Ktedonobacteraceae bacterium]